MSAARVEAFHRRRSRGESLKTSWAKVFLDKVKQRQGGGKGHSSRMTGRPRRGRLVEGEVEGERERLRGEKGERVTFDDVLAELGEFGREQKVCMHLSSL